MPVRISPCFWMAAIVVLAVAGSADVCRAEERGDGVGRGYTRYMWSRTWHAQNAVTMPLNQYFVPRSPGDCGNGSNYTAGGSAMGVAGGAPNHYGAYPYAPNAAIGFEPMQPERLGKVPNELAVGNLLQPMPSGPPAAAAPGR